MYPRETGDDVMSDNVNRLSDEVIGHRITSVERGSEKWTTTINLDNGKRVKLVDSGDCCAYTDMEDVLFNIEHVDNLVLGVGTTGEYTTWHVFCDLGDVLQLKVGWSEGSGYYMYGFDILVEDADDTKGHEEV